MLIGSAPWMCRALASSAPPEERPYLHTPALASSLFPLLTFSRLSGRASSLKRGLRSTAFAKATRREGSAQYLCPGKAGTCVVSLAEIGFGLSKITDKRDGLLVDACSHFICHFVSFSSIRRMMTKPSLLCSNRQQTVEARFFSPRPARLWWRSVCERTGRSNRTVFNGALKRTVTLGL